MYTLSEILRGKPKVVEDDIRILRNFVEYRSGEDKMEYIIIEMEIKDRDGSVKHLFKAIKMYRLIKLPDALKQAKQMMDIHSQILSSFWENGINFISIIARIEKTGKDNPIGLMQLYGVQGVAKTVEEAKRIADAYFNGLTSALQGSYRTMEFRLLNHKEAEWLREKMANMKHIQIVRGIPVAKKASSERSIKGIGNHDTDPDSEETTEQFAAGLVDHEFIAMTLASPIEYDVLENWLVKASKAQTHWNSIMQGTTSMNAGINIPIVFAANLGSALGSSDGISDTTTEGYSRSRSQSYSTSESISRSYGFSRGTTVSVSESFGESAGISHSEGGSLSASMSHARGWSQGISENFGFSENQSIGSSHNIGINRSTGINESFGINQSESVSQTEGVSFSEGVSHNRGVSQSESASYTRGISESIGLTEGKTSTVSRGLSTSTSFSNSQTSNFSQSRSVGQSYSNSVSQSYSKGYSNSTNYGLSVGHGTSKSLNLNVGIKKVIDGGGGMTWSNNIAGNVSKGITHSTNITNGVTSSKGINFSDTITKGSSLGFTESHGQTSSTSTSVSNSTSLSRSSGTSESWGTSQTVGSSESWGYSQTQGQSFSRGQSFSQGTSYSQGISQSWGESESWGESVSAGRGRNWGVGTSEGISGSDTISHSKGINASDGWNRGLSYSQSRSVANSFTESQSVTHSQSVSKGYSTGEGESWSRGIGKSSSVSNSISHGLSTSMGIGASLGVGKTYQFLDAEVQNIVELLEFQKIRLKTAIHGGTGAFYTDMYIATETEEAKNAAATAAKFAWHDENAMVCPLQVLEPDEEETAHLLYHFNAFSACPKREMDRFGQLESYKYSTVLTSNELTAYTHVIRLSDGGLYADIQNIPELAVPSEMKGEIYIGKILSGYRWSVENGYRTPFDYRIANENIMHGLFAGGSRSGKTVTALRCVAEMANHIRRGPKQKRLRIIVMDPKRDWRKLARFVEPERFRIYSMGDTNKFPFKLNPMKVPYGVDPEFHLDTLIDVFCRAYGLGIRSVTIMLDALKSLYDKAGVFDTEDPAEITRRSATVTLADAWHILNKKKENKEFGRDKADAVDKVLDRLSRFAWQNGVLYKLYCQTDGMSIDELLGDDDVVVLESGKIQSNNMAFLFGFITASIYMYAKYCPGNFLADDQYETLLVVEEANRVLTGESQAGESGIQGQSIFEEMLDQAAGLGLFVFSITQQPSKMPTSILANSGLLFAGRMTIDADIEIMLTALGRDTKFDDRQIKKFFPKSPTGWFICKSSRTFDYKESEAVLVQVDPLDVSEPSDEELANIMLKRQIELETRKIKEQIENINK